jgi:predicted Zn-dependent protease
MSNNDYDKKSLYIAFFNSKNNLIIRKVIPMLKKRITKNTIQKITISFLLITCIAYANAQQDNSALTYAVKKELNRSFAELQKEERPPYFISYQVIEKSTHRINTSFGKLVSNANNHTRFLDIDLRVGDYKLDNSHIIRGHYDFGSNISSIALPLENEENAIRNAIWNVTDRAYRRAIEKYEKAVTNETVKVAAEDTSADFSREKPTKYNESFKELTYYNERTRIFLDPKLFLAIDTNKWIEMCKKLSNRFVEHQWLLNGEVSFSAELINKLFVNTEGTEVQHPETSLRINIYAKTKAEDGMILPLYKSYFAFESSELPTEETLVKDIDEMIELLDRLRNAEMAATFTGPAILSGEAAGVFFHEIFGHRVEGFREKDPDASNTFKQSIGKKVLPDFLSVVFDPTIRAAANGEPLSGYYLYDDEGIKGEKVVTIKDGIFQNFLMSRSPIEGFENSNGHGRKAQGRSVVTRQSNLIVQASETKTQNELRKMLIEEAKKQEKEYGLYFGVVAGGFTLITRYYPNSFNVTPLVVYKIFVDGRPDELVRGVDLIGTPLATFSSIVAAADDIGIFNGMCGAESGRVPVSSVSPSLLVSKIEVQKKSKSQAKLPILPSPIIQNETP